MAYFTIMVLPSATAQARALTGADAGGQQQAAEAELGARRRRPRARSPAHAYERPFSAVFPACSQPCLAWWACQPSREHAKGQLGAAAQQEFR